MARKRDKQDSAAGRIDRAAQGAAGEDHAATGAAGLLQEAGQGPDDAAARIPEADFAAASPAEGLHGAERATPEDFAAAIEMTAAETAVLVAGLGADAGGDAEAGAEAGAGSAPVPDAAPAEEAREPVPSAEAPAGLPAGADDTLAAAAMAADPAESRAQGAAEDGPAAAPEGRAAETAQADQADAPEDAALALQGGAEAEAAAPEAPSAPALEKAGEGARPAQGAGTGAAASGQDEAAQGRTNPLTVPDLPVRLAENIERIESLGQRLLAALAARPMHTPAVEGPGPAFYGSVAGAWFRLAAQQPARIIEQQVRFWGQTLRHVAAAQEAFARNLSAPRTEAPEDRRFRNPLWQTNPFYSFVRNQYQINADALRQAAADLSIENEAERRRVEWFTRQMIDMLAPTNFLATNPDALQRAIETEGESLVRGLENLVRDIERGGGDLVVSLADPDAFQVGENIGATPGEVVHRTDLFELIQFAPTTDQVHRTPVVVFPPWINKYYIMDLRPQNSLLRWIVDQGYTLFVVSWKNPRAEDAGLSMDDYVAAYLDVIGKVLDLTEEPQLNAVGYCIAGTTLSAALALMHQQGDERIRSATFLTTLTDFSDQGEFTTFLQDDFVGGIEDEVARTGYLSSQLMQRTFSFLRANDLVWGPAIRSYMMGETPPAFDLLYWNGDGTNLPGRMVTQYLRDLCQRNALAADGFEILGRRVHLSEVTLPLCAVACENDHIAPWLHSWAGVAQMGSPDKTFILSESGHVAGIINPPGRVKYGHYISDAGYGGGAEAWRAAAEFRPGSWWTLWGAWLAERSGEMIPARAPRDGFYPAPGRYVLEKAC